MEQISRSPGSTAVVQRTTTRRYFTNTWYSTTSAYLVDKRPTYTYGTVITLGDRIYRKPTSYSHSAYQCTVKTPYSGAYTSGGFLGRKALDEGRESAAISAKYGKSLFGGTDHPSTTSLGMNEAIVKALLQLADNKAGIGEDIATFGQTLRLLSGKSSILLGALRAMRSRKSLQRFMRMSIHELGKNPLDKAAQLYIEYVYGLRPLVQDVYGVAQLIKQHDVNSFLLHGRGKSSRTESASPQTAWNSGYSYSDERVKSSVETAHNRCDLWAKLDPNYAGFRALNQLGLLNPASLAWDLVPWSFVVDWFVPVGSVLQAFSAPVGLNFVSGSKAIRSTGNRQIEFRVNSTWLNPYSSSVTTYSNGLLDIEYQGYQRTALSGWPLPGFYYSTDPFRGDRSLKALALGILQLKRWRDSPR